MFESFIYRRSPVFVQGMLVSARGATRSIIRERIGVNDLREEILGNQYLTQDRIREYATKRAERVLSIAAYSVPFYQSSEYRDALSLSLPFNDFAFSQLPMIDKDVIRFANRGLVSVNARRPLLKISSSGTTGTPLTMQQDMQAVRREGVFLFRQLLWAGYYRGARRAWIRGDLVVDVHRDEPPFWRMSAAENMLMFSSYHLSSPNAPAYLERLARFDPVIIQAYPSSVALLAAFLESSEGFYEGESLRGIVTSSETLHEADRHRIEERFGAKVFDWYGQAERVAAIGTCEEGSYHAMTDYSWIEFLPVADGLHEIVGTTLNNLAMPLLRYRTGDFVELGDSDKCDCGRAFPFVRKIQGRSDDYVKLSDGRRIGRMDHVFKGVEGLLEAQIRQESADEILIFVVPSTDFNESTLQKIEHNVRLRVGDLLSPRFITVPQIERTGSGKLRNVICEI
jgi:phenylacetate-CoA ligase